MSPDERIDRTLAKQLLAVAICNYYRATASGTEIQFKAVNELTEAELSFFTRAAEKCLAIIWAGE